MRQHCYIHSQYQDTCRMCRLAERNITRHDDVLADNIYNTAREDSADDNSGFTLSTLSTVIDSVVDTSTDRGTNDTSITDNSSDNNSGNVFDGGSSGGGGSDF